MSERQYWLMKSEPEAYSIDDLKRDDVEPWDGIRNYEARNTMRDEMKIGDRALFYHSNVKPPVIVGTMEICSEPYPDPTQFDPDSKYFDEKSSESDPTWQLVDVKFVQRFDQPVTRDQLKEDKTFENMQLFKRNRLSITSVTPEEYHRILELAGAEEK
jgi:predicted RNA-binding protein with PUA-like domain